MLRKRNDSQGYKRGAMGIDGAKDEGFSRKNLSSPWNPPSVNGKADAGIWDNEKPSVGSDNYSVTREKKPDDDWRCQGAEGRSLGGRDIFDAVEGQSSDSGSRAVKSGDQD